MLRSIYRKMARQARREGRGTSGRDRDQAATKAERNQEKPLSLRARKTATIRSTARLVLSRMEIDTAAARQFLARKRPGFHDVLGRAPYGIQSRLFELVPSPLGSLTILKSSTGSGKTEAAIAYFMSLFIAGLVGGLYLSYR